MREWARQDGYEVADRGRLPAEVTEAYRAANGGGAKKPRKTASKAAPKKAPQPATVVEAPQAEQPRTPGPKPSVVTDDRRLVALGEEIKALTARVEALEKASGGGKGSTGKTRFRRRS